MQLAYPPLNSTDLEATAFPRIRSLNLVRLAYLPRTPGPTVESRSLYSVIVGCFVYLLMEFTAKSVASLARRDN